MKLPDPCRWAVYGLLWLASGFDSTCADVPSATSLLQTNLRLRRTRRADVCMDTIPVPGSTTGMPAIGYIACCQERDMDPANVRPAVARYLVGGGRHVMTAPGYYNEGAVGQAMQDSGVPRDQIWVTTALDPVNVPKNNIRQWVAEQLDASLHRLNTTYADVVYMHWGVTLTRHVHGEKANVTEEMNVELYRGLLEEKRTGKIRHVGVGLHTQKEIEYLINSTGVTPDIMYGWITPFMPVEQIAYAMWAKSQGMTVFAWGPFNWPYLDDPEQLAAHRAVTGELAEKYGATDFQIIARWYLDKGMAFGTSMLKPSYVEENMHCLQTPLSVEDRQRLEAVKWGCHKTDKVQLLPGCFD